MGWGLAAAARGKAAAGWGCTAAGADEQLGLAAGDAHSRKSGRSYGSADTAAQHSAAQQALHTWAAGGRVGAGGGGGWEAAARGCKEGAG